MKNKSYLLIFLFCNLCFLIKGSKDSKGCSFSNLFSIEPAADIYRDRTKTFGLSDSFFIGTGTEFHSRGHGKYVKKRKKVFLPKC